MTKKTNVYIQYSLVGLLICLAVFSIFYFSLPGLLNSRNFDQAAENTREPILGQYLPAQNSTNHFTDVPHYTIKWTNSWAWSFRDKMLPPVDDRQNLLISLEFWNAAGTGNYQKGVLKAIINGEYDKKIRKFCQAIAERPQLVYLRWNPEMEVPAGHYPWQNQSPGPYIQAFRHFAKLCMAEAPNIRIVWGPAGYPGTLEFWPGSDVVDMVSISLHSTSELQTSAYPKIDSMPYHIKRKLHRLRFVDKPVLVLGSEEISKEDYQQEWLQLAATEIKKAEQTIGHNYRRAAEPDPDFRKKNRKAGSNIRLGVYDPKQQLTAQRPVTIEHLFTDLTEIENGSFKQRLDSVATRKHDLIITVEPWPGGEARKDFTDNPLEQTLKGQYDGILEKLFQQLATVDQTIYLRFAHEMEIPIERYAWQSQDPIQYIQAYRYFAGFKKPLPANIRLVWGPAGDRGSLEWWPGHDVVDYISLAVYGQPDKNIHNFRDQESFSTIVNRKLHRMRFANKPVFITEFGVKGPADFQKKWLEDAARTIRQSPEITGVCYFNLYDNPGVWGEGDTPDWGISEDTFIYFTEVLED